MTPFGQADVQKDGVGTKRRRQSEGFFAIVGGASLEPAGAKKTTANTLEAGFDQHMTKPLDPLAVMQLFSEYERSSEQK